MDEMEVYCSEDKIRSYMKNKTNITFRLVNHPEYFITGIIKDIKANGGFITVELNNKELAYFIFNEIDYETIIPTSYNPIRYFSRGIITPELREEVFKTDNYQCKNNLQGCTNKAECCDHIIPVIKGGLTILDNLHASCNNCNLKKGSNMIL